MSRVFFVHNSLFHLILAFFDEFERQTQGENFSSVANVVAKEEDEKLREQELQQKEREELDEFFDEFEKSTQGENFKRTT